MSWRFWEAKAEHSSHQTQSVSSALIERAEEWPTIVPEHSTAAERLRNVQHNWTTFAEMFEVSELVSAYVTALETEETDSWCHCNWAIHPDDHDKPEGKRRKRRIDVSPTCPVHTKEGFLLYFLEWVTTH